MTCPPTRSTRGFTLIELLVAVSILALVSVMAVNLLSAGVFQREALTRHDSTAQALNRAVSLLRQDLEAAVPIALPAGGAMVLRGAQDITWMRSTLSDVPGLPSPPFMPVRWRVGPDGTLTRTLGLAPELEPELEPERAGVEMLRDVSALRLVPFGPGVMPSTAADVASDSTTDTASAPLTALPPGFDLSFTQGQHGALRIVVLR